MAVIDQTNSITKLQECIDPSYQLATIIPPTNGTFMKDKRKKVKKVDVYFTVYGVYFKRKIFEEDPISSKF